ncbi:MAG: tRNA (guanine(10)-N(2))-dimethyltransferase [Candidatus Hodarchaeota archaeon]
MALDMALKQLVEGKATIDVPDLDRIPGLDTVPRKKQPVFYNPIQILNRDFSVLLLATLNFDSSDLSICEPMCGTGIRGIRYALEITSGIAVLMNDLNPLATRLTNHNVLKNSQAIKKQGCDTKVLTGDAIWLLIKQRKEEQYFDVIDIDPFGSPARYFSSSVLALKRDGILCFTATDMPVLTGIYPAKAYKRYGITNIYRTPFCHEVALRILIASIQREALRYSIRLMPILSFSADHYVRIFLRGSRIASDEILRNTGYIGICRNCKKHHVVPMNFNDNRCDCDSIIPLIGPLWVGLLHENDLIEAMQKRIVEVAGLRTHKRITRFLNLFKEENTVPLPYHYDIHKISKQLSLMPPGTEQLREKLVQRGEIAAKTHFSGIGLKTTMPINELLDLIQEMQNQ